MKQPDTITKEMLLSVKVPPPEKVTVPKLGVAYIRCMTGLQQEEMTSHINARYPSKEGDKERSTFGVTLGLVCHTLVTKDNVRLFKDEEIGDLESLPASVLVPIKVKALEVNKMGEKDKEELGKN